jgi:hypothetical protein
MGCHIVDRWLRGFEFFEFENFQLLQPPHTLPIVTMSTLDKNLVFTQRILEKMEVTLSVSLLEKEAAFAVAERMVALLACFCSFLFFFVADLLVLVFSRIIAQLGL